MGCASLSRQWWHGEGMRRPKRAMVARRGDAPAKNGYSDECAGAKNVAALLITAVATKRRREECCDLNIPLTSILMRQRRWCEECHDFDISSCSAASSERTNREIGNGGAAMRCTG